MPKPPDTATKMSDSVSEGSNAIHISEVCFPHSTLLRVRRFVLFLGQLACKGLLRSMLHKDSSLSHVQVAYLIPVMHALKYPANSVNGVLLGTAEKHDDGSFRVKVSHAPKKTVISASKHAWILVFFGVSISLTFLPAFFFSR